ncbi:MAG: 3-phosphoshikimate 1-carboxyvinyltransferase, partial [Bifidobacteriaceae bacterium]|nr:3-phosphoshikimate 1-carboxyvinyltransferase [Bifidobacteriaceae bacterium]
MSGPRAAPWPAPLAGGPLDATVTLPGSKSLTARYLVLAALAATPSRLRGALVSRDTRLMAAALGALGASVQWEDDAGTPVARVTPGQIVAGGRVDCGLAGTVMRFIPPIAALAPGPVALDGDPAARRRPMAPLIEALRSLGVAVDDAGRGA